MQERMTMPVPKFFKKVRNVGLLLGAIGVPFWVLPLCYQPVLLPLPGIWLRRAWSVLLCRLWRFDMIDDFKS